jgi:hypothetical protein
MMHNSQGAGAVGNKAILRVIGPTEVEQRITSARIEKLDHQETNGNGDQITTQKRIGTVTNCRETDEGRRNRADAGICMKAPPPPLRTDRHHGKTDTSLVTQGWVGDKPCRVAVDTGAYDVFSGVTRHNIMQLISVAASEYICRVSINLYSNIPIKFLTNNYDLKDIQDI